MAEINPIIVRFFNLTTDYITASSRDTAMKERVGGERWKRQFESSTYEKPTDQP